jgi:hypothetical protein
VHHPSIIYKLDQIQKPVAMRKDVETPLDLGSTSYLCATKAHDHKDTTIIALPRRTKQRAPASKKVFKACALNANGVSDPTRPWRHASYKSFHFASTTSFYAPTNTLPSRHAIPQERFFCQSYSRCACLYARGFVPSCMYDPAMRESSISAHTRSPALSAL